MVHPPSQPLHVLLVEDDSALRACLVDLLAMLGYAVQATGHGQHAVEMARERAFDFTLLDFHLPGMTGLDVLEVIRTEIRPLPSIMMSGEATREDAVRALHAGVFQFLRKPLRLDQLRETVALLVQTQLAQGPAAPPSLAMKIRLPGQPTLVRRNSTIQPDRTPRRRPRP